MGSRVKIFDNLRNISGKTVPRRMVIFESDDWGSIRMPSLLAYQRLKSYNINLIGKDALRYNLNDSLATSSDLTMLFDIITSFKDNAGNPCIFTPITIVANPDFQKIQSSGFKEYHYEPFTQTLRKIKGCERSFELWEEGIRGKFFIPQMHGREHLNVNAWMKALLSGDEETHLAFNEGFWSFASKNEDLAGIDFQAAFFLSDPQEIGYHKRVIIEGLDLFFKIFKYKAEYFVPPNGQFNNSLNQVLVENGIKYRSVSKMQNESIGFGKSRKVINWLGKKDPSGLRYITRNCFFEPSQPGKDWIDSCLRDIEIAFRWKKPAIVSTHRVNYIGALNLNNRYKGLLQLRTLIKSIIKTWPDVEFISTTQLGNFWN
jgi:hypothetical protein